MKISVLLCTHNPRRDFLVRVFEALRRQTLEPAIWDLILVDNASTPPVTLADLPPLPVSVQVLPEPKLGSLYARLAGLKAATSEVVVLVDDDNVLQPDYLGNVRTFLQQHPNVGAVGGIVEPEFESPPPAWLTPHLNLLALRNFGPAEVVSDWKSAPRAWPWCAPFGAGMALRTICARQYVQRISEAKKASVGRTGTTFLGGCEDAEIILYGVLETGREVAYTPALRLTHLIPDRRLQRDYLSRLAYQTGTTWGEFCVRHGFWQPVSRWTVPLRALVWFFRDRAWTSAGWLTWRTSTGRLAGRLSS